MKKQNHLSVIHQIHQQPCLLNLSQSSKLKQIALFTTANHQHWALQCFVLCWEKSHVDKHSEPTWLFRHKREPYRACLQNDLFHLFKRTVISREMVSSWEYIQGGCIFLHGSNNMSSCTTQVLLSSSLSVWVSTLNGIPDLCPVSMIAILAKIHSSLGSLLCFPLLKVLV